MPKDTTPSRFLPWLVVLAVAGCFFASGSTLVPVSAQVPAPGAAGGLRDALASRPAVGAFVGAPRPRPARAVRVERGGLETSRRLAEPVRLVRRFVTGARLGRIAWIPYLLAAVCLFGADFLLWVGAVLGRWNLGFLARLAVGSARAALAVLRLPAWLLLIMAPAILINEAEPATALLSAAGALLLLGDASRASEEAALSCPPAPAKTEEDGGPEALGFVRLEPGIWHHPVTRVTLTDAEMKAALLLEGGVLSHLVR